jgi:glycosyltransferase involved in cell wall biosynthesis
MSAERKRVLVSAYACEPGNGSEPAVGWNWALQIARFHEVWVITRRSNRQVVEQGLRENQSSGVRWIFFDLPGWARFWKRGQRGVHLYYFLWQIGAYFVVRRLCRQVRFDLVHHVTFVNYWLGSLLPFLPVPFVWGPVGGGEDCPRALRRSFGWGGRCYELLRAGARWLGEHNPVLRAAAVRVKVALATTPETRKRLETLCCRRVEMMSEAGIGEEEIAVLGGVPERQGGTFRALSIGRLLHWKGFHLSILAFAAMHRVYPDSEYHLIGAGPELGRLLRLAHSLGVAGSVRFWGLLPRSQALRHLGTCNVLVHPSLHDSGGWVCLEALVAGRPVICLDTGGPATQVTPQCGFLVRPAAPERVAAEISGCLLALARDPELQSRLGGEGRRRVAATFNWEVKGRRMIALYEECLR